VTLELQVPDPDRMVRGQKRELVRLLSNLLINAIQHSPAGGMVRVELDQQGSNLRVAVSDQGPGIAACEQERIFERFYRSDASRSRQSGGTGLGLAIARAIACRHRGCLSVQSTLGAGSTFLLQMPALT
jgi:two-component Ni(II)/redox sensor kinase NrsS